MVSLTFGRSDVIREMSNPIAILVNLLYLIKHNRDDPSTVLRYSEMADTQTRCLLEIIRRDDASMMTTIISEQPV